MSRAIITKHLSAEMNRPADKPADALLKLLPAETTAAYLMVVSIVRTAGDDAEKVTWVLGAGGVLLLLTIPYLKWVGKVRHWLQYAATLVGFVIWAASLGWPLQQLIGYETWQIASIISVYNVALVISAVVATRD